MNKQNVAFALITTVGGEHLVIHRLKTNDYGLPGGKVAEGEHPKAALIREIFEETGLKFDQDDFELINIQNLNQEGNENTIYAYGCNKVISDAAPIWTAEKHIKPMFLEPSMFYTLTSYKEFYTNLFPQEG